MDNKDKIINRLKIAYEKLLLVHNESNDPAQRQYIKCELEAIKISRDIVRNAFHTGGDDRYAIIDKIDICMKDLALDYDKIEAKGHINGYAMALALYHDNEQQL